MKRKYKSEALEAIHESARDMHEIGLLSDERMRHFDEACLVQPVATVPRAATQKPASAFAGSGAPVYARGK
jgi:putative transcriptional regulator